MSPLRTIPECVGVIDGRVGQAPVRCPFKIVFTLGSEFCVPSEEWGAGRPSCEEHHAIHPV